MKKDVFKKEFIIEPSSHKRSNGSIIKQTRFLDEINPHYNLIGKPDAENCIYYSDLILAVLIKKGVVEKI